MSGVYKWIRINFQVFGNHRRNSINCLPFLLISVKFLLLIFINEIEELVATQTRHQRVFQCLWLAVFHLLMKFKFACCTQILQVTNIEVPCWLSIIYKLRHRTYTLRQFLLFNKLSFYLQTWFFLTIRERKSIVWPLIKWHRAFLYLYLWLRSLCRLNTHFLPGLLHNFIHLILNEIILYNVLEQNRCILVYVNFRWRYKFHSLPIAWSVPIWLPIRYPVWLRCFLLLNSTHFFLVDVLELIIQKWVIADIIKKHGLVIQVHSIKLVVHLHRHLLEWVIRIWFYKLVLRFWTFFSFLQHRERDKRLKQKMAIYQYIS